MGACPTTKHACRVDVSIAPPSDELKEGSLMKSSGNFIGDPQLPMSPFILGHSM
jgi:hypothetical protein